MGIVGFRLHYILGWILGTVFIDKPWGLPTFKTWKSPHTFWCLAVLIIQQILYVDFLIIASKNSSLEISTLAHYLHKIMFFVSYLVYCIVKFIFFMNAKNLATLLSSLYNYQTNEDGNCMWTSMWNKFRVMTFISTVSVCAFSAVFILELQSHFLQESLLSFTGWYGQLVIGFFFGCLATSTASNISFVLISTITFHMGRMLYNFCDHLEKKFEERSNDCRIAMFEKEFVILSRASRRNPKQIFKRSTTLTTEELGTIQKFEEIEKLFKIADKIISPLTFVVIVSGTFNVVTGAHEILLNTKLTTALVLSNYLVVLENIIHTIGLVMIGQYVKDKAWVAISWFLYWGMMNNKIHWFRFQINEKKSSLHRKLILMSSMTSPQEDHFMNLVKWVLEYEWKLSWCKFFDVDRRLLSGVKWNVA